MFYELWCSYYEKSGRIEAFFCPESLEQKKHCCQIPRKIKIFSVKCDTAQHIFFFPRPLCAEAWVDWGCRLERSCFCSRPDPWSPAATHPPHERPKTRENLEPAQITRRDTYPPTNQDGSHSFCASFSARLCFTCCFLPKKGLLSVPTCFHESIFRRDSVSVFWIVPGMSALISLQALMFSGTRVHFFLESFLDYSFLWTQVDGLLLRQNKDPSHPTEATGGQNISTSWKQNQRSCW